MPETLFRVRWPDGQIDTCYSPSTIIERHLDPSRAYPPADFMAACRSGLQAASERVRAVHGSGCSRALTQIGLIEAKARKFTGDSEARVTIVDFSQMRQEI